MDPFAERLPYIVTLLFAAIGWGVTHTVDRIVKAPIVEYRTEVVSAAESSVFVATLRNLSDERVYKKVSLMLLFNEAEAGRFVSAQLLASPPAWSGDAAPQVADESVRFLLAELHPGWEVRLLAEYTGKAKPVIRLRSADPTLRLMPPSLETFLLAHEVTIIVVVIVVWAALLLVIGLRRGPRQPLERPH